MVGTLTFAGQTVVRRYKNTKVKLELKSYFRETNIKCNVQNKGAIISKWGRNNYFLIIGASKACGTRNNIVLYSV